MKHARVVIGSNFGDEGKGLMTDYFAREAGGAGVLVARFNGGAQAGHTVVAPDARRHVFSHFGSGSLAGADTLLAREFIANPILFARERLELAALNVEPRVFVDPGCLLSTPFDMILNEMAETARGAGRHGSVGLGINETVTRAEHPQFRLSVADALAGGRPDAIASCLRAVRDEWMPARVATLGLEAEYTRRSELIGQDGLITHWVEVLNAFLDATTVRHDTQVLSAYDDVVFEGAQGLALDQTRGQFPHVTRSNTGVRNVVEIMAEMPDADIHVTYATRAYMTRHGAGPLDGEMPGPPFPGVYDMTNVPHEFQGRLRFALLDVDGLHQRIRQDFGDAHAGLGPLRVRMDLALTCLDQLPARASWTMSGRRHSGSQDQMIEAVRGSFDSPVFVSRGPGATDVIPHLAPSMIVSAC